jgi:acetylornithine deacetylase/succinyl-diaminopimelate desuccinylase-like protein
MQMLAQKLRQHVTSQMPGYVEGLQRLVANPSYTRDRTGVQKEAQILKGVFERNNMLTVQDEFFEGRDKEYGEHVIFRIGRGSASRRSYKSYASNDKGSKTRKVGFVSHLDTVYPEPTLKKDDHRWKVVSSTEEVETLRAEKVLVLSDEVTLALKERLASGVGPIAYGPGTMDIKGGSIIALATLEVHPHLHPYVCPCLSTLSNPYICYHLCPSLCPYPTRIRHWRAHAQR